MLTQKCLFPSTDPIDTAKTVIQADVTGAKYRGMLQALPELYRTNGMTRLYSGGLARTIRTCGAFFIVRRSLLLIASIYAMPLSLTAAHPLQVLTHYLYLPLRIVPQVSTIREKCIQFKARGK